MASYKGFNLLLLCAFLEFLCFTFAVDLMSDLPVATDNQFQWSQHSQGTYRFGMQGKDQWRVERRYPDGRTYIHYAFKTPDGQVVEEKFSRGGSETPSYLLKMEGKTRRGQMTRMAQPYGFLISTKKEPKWEDEYVDEETNSIVVNLVKRR